MSEWKKVTFKNAPLEIIDGDRGTNYPKQSDFLTSGYCLFLNAGNVTREGFSFSNCTFISQEKDSILRKGKLKKYDTILTTRGTVGNVAFFDDSVQFKNIRINSGMVILRPKPENLDPRYLYLFVRSADFQEQLLAMLSGSAQPQLPIRDINQIVISLPPLSEQKAIARILGSLDDKIELNRRMNETLEAMARAIFKDWFVDFGPTRAKIEGRAPYLPEPIWSLFPDAIDPQSGLPVGWEKKPLPEVIDFKEGPGIRNWQYTNSEEGTRFINIRCIQDNDLNLKTANRITNDEANGKYSHFHLREWDIVVSTSGTLGRSAIVRKEHLPLVLNTSVIRFRPIDQKITKSFLFLYLNSPYFLEELMAMASGSVQKNFGPMHLKKMRVLTPPFDLVCQFEKRAGSLLNKVICNRSESDSLAELRDRLLPKLMSGQIRVKDAEKLVEEVL